MPIAKAVHAFQDTLKGQMSGFAPSEQLPSTPASHTQGPATVSSEKHSGLSLLAHPWLRNNLGSTARCLRASGSSTALQPSGRVYLSHCFCCSACFKLPTTPGHHSCGQRPHRQVTTLYPQAMTDVELCCHQAIGGFTITNFSFKHTTE